MTTFPLDLSDALSGCEIHACPDETMWHVRRRLGIGASDAAPLLGLNPKKSPFALYTEKIGLTVDSQDDEWLWWGHHMEPVIAEWYTQKKRVALIDIGQYTVLQSKAYPWMQATLDRVATTGEGFYSVDFKNSRWVTEADLEDGTPPYWYVQGQHQLAVTGWPYVDFAACLAGQKGVAVRVERNEDFMFELIGQEELFDRRVQERNPPPIDGSESTAKALARLFPKSIGGEIVPLPPEADEWAKELLEVKEQIKHFQEQEELLKNQFKATIGDAFGGCTQRGVTYTLKLVEKQAYMVQAKSYRELRRKSGKS